MPCMAPPHGRRLGSARTRCDGAIWTATRTGLNQQAPSSTLLSPCEGCGEPVEGDGLAAQRAGAEDDGEHKLQFVQGLVEGHPGACAFGSVRILVMKAWARAARVTWRCQPV